MKQMAVLTKRFDNFRFCVYIHIRYERKYNCEISQLFQENFSLQYTCKKTFYLIDENIFQRKFFSKFRSFRNRDQVWQPKRNQEHCNPSAILFNDVLHLGEEQHARLDSLSGIMKIMLHFYWI